MKRINRKRKLRSITYVVDDEVHIAEGEDNYEYSICLWEFD